MKGAVISSGGEVAVNFNAAGEIYVFDCSGSGKFLEKPFLMGDLIDLLTDEGVRVLICGGIRRMDERFLYLNGFRVIPWIRGKVEDVVESFCGGDVLNESNFMPGRHRFRKGFGWRKF